MSSTLDLVLKLISKDIALEAWTSDYTDRGEKVAQARRYVDGDHNANLTAKKLEQLNLPLSTKSAFQANYCDTVVQTMADRIELETITADNDKATQWAQTVWDDNDLDSLQVDVHEAAARDGDSYLMVSPEGGKPIFSYEPAWDGTQGMMIFYSHEGGRRTIKIAIKVWSEMDVLRTNLYYADRVAKYSNAGGNGLQLIDEQPWVDRAGQPLGVPVFHFANRRDNREDFGLSELENVIPLQDALNRTIHSMVMASEYTAFQLYYSIGLPAPAKISPGSWFAWYEETTDGGVKLGVDPSRKYEIGKLDAGDLAPFIDECKFFIQQIGFVSRTPSPEMMASDNSSGESLKQREIGLLGKVRKFQTKNSPSWRNVFHMAHKVQETFGEIPPAVARFTPVWHGAELRNDAEYVAILKSIRDDLPREEFLALVGQVIGWDAEKAKAIAAARDAEDARAAAVFNGQLPQVDNFSLNA